MNNESKNVRRVKLVVAYDGTNYHGWQIQQNGVTIEGVLNDTLTDLLGEPITVIGASRTDSGVHAMGNVAVFDTVNRMPADKICYALNQRLPEDIRIQESMAVPNRWHPRKCRCTKTYEYHILNRKMDMPIHRLYSHFCYTPLDVDKMREAAEYLIGEHDFKSFCTARSQLEDMVRTIYSLDVKRRGEMITLRISGSGFLYNMVRIIAGTLINVGKGLTSPEEVETILLARDRRMAGPTVSAKGLTLVNLAYEQEMEEWFCRENREWNYDILQTHILTDKTAYFLIERCLDEEWNGLLARNIHQAVRDGAECVYLIDLEKDRLRSGDTYGYYEIREIEDMAAAMGMLTEDESEAIMEIHCMARRQTDTYPVWYCAYETQKALENLDFQGKKS